MTVGCLAGMWDAVGAIATFVAAGVALWIGLEPRRTRANQEKQQLAISSKLVLVELGELRMFGEELRCAVKPIAPPPYPLLLSCCMESGASLPLDVAETMAAVCALASSAASPYAQRNIVSLNGIGEELVSLVETLQKLMHFKQEELS